MNNLHEKRSEAGCRGGLATLAKYGADHFKKIGAEGARVFWKRYRFEPVGMDDFAIVRRDNHAVVALLSGLPFQRR